MQASENYSVIFYFLLALVDRIYMFYEYLSFNMAHLKLQVTTMSCHREVSAAVSSTFECT